MAARNWRWTRWCAVLPLVCGVLFAARETQALITGGVGNEPMGSPNWPAGASAVFNVNSRVAWWEDPPYGGGQFHAECRGDAAAFNAVLEDFAKITAVSRKLIVHDGVAQSFWLNIRNEPDQREQAQIDWTFTVWDSESWKHQQRLPEQLRSNQDGNSELPAPIIDVYVGGNINWADVTVPDGIDVVDERLAAHGFTASDGVVLEGTVVDAESSAALAAMAHLEQIGTKDGKYEYIREQSAPTDATGRWVLKNVPAGWFRVTVEAPDHVPRIAGFERPDGSPRWHSLPTKLVQTAGVSGIVQDAQGNPLADVRVRLDDVVIGNGEVYRTPNDLTAMTDAAGGFAFHDVPVGRTSVWVQKSGYVRSGLGEPVETPAQNLTLTMQSAATARVVVDFGTLPRPDAYIVEMEPEGGNVIGSYGGSATLPADNVHEFDNVPAGTYVFYGRPNPGSADQETERVKVELHGGETTTVTLKAR